MTERTAGGFVEWRVKLWCIQIVSFLVAPKMDRRPLSPDFSVKPGIFFFFKGRRKKEEFLLLERCVPWLTAAIKRRRQLSNPILIVFRNRISSTWLPHYSTPTKLFLPLSKKWLGKENVLFELNFQGTNVSTNTGISIDVTKTNFSTRVCHPSELDKMTVYLEKETVPYVAIHCCYLVCFFFFSKICQVSHLLTSFYRKSFLAWTPQSALNVHVLSRLRRNEQ